MGDVRMAIWSAGDAAPSLRPMHSLAGVTVIIGLVFYCYALNSFGATGVTTAAMLVILGAAAISSVAGFAFSALCGAGLLHIIDSPVIVVQVMLICSIGIQSLSVWALRREVDGHA